MGWGEHCAGLSCVLVSRMDKPNRDPLYQPPPFWGIPQHFWELRFGGLWLERWIRNCTVSCLWPTSNSCRARKQRGRSCFWQVTVLRTQLQIYPILGASVKWVLHKTIWKFPLSYKMLWCMICLLIAADDWICWSNKCVGHRLCQIRLCISHSVKWKISIMHMLIRWLLPGLKVRMMFTTRKTYYRPQTYIWKQAETKQISSPAGAAYSMKRKGKKNKNHSSQMETVVTILGYEKESKWVSFGTTTSHEQKEPLGHSLEGIETCCPEK